MKTTEDWDAAIERISRTTTYRREEIEEAAAIARYGTYVETPTDFVEVAQWCAGGDLKLAPYLRQVESMIATSHPSMYERAARRERLVRAATALGALLFLAGFWFALWRWAAS